MYSASVSSSLVALYDNSDAVLRALLASSSFLARNNDCRCKPAALGSPRGVLLGFKSSQSSGPCLLALRGSLRATVSSFNLNDNHNNVNNYNVIHPKMANF